MTATTGTGVAVCPCGSGDYRQVLRSGRYCVYGRATAPLEFALLKCRRCGLVRTWPQPADDEHTPFRDDSFLGPYLERPELYESFMRPVVEEVRRLRPPPGRLLDVGANVGTLVRLAGEAGYEATGVELNEAAVEHGRARGLDLRCVSLERAGFDPGSADVIVMSATAEHIPDFDSEVGRCRELLRPGGLLYLANTPNYGSFGRFLEREMWYGIQPTGHVWQFTPRTLRAVVLRNGFRVVSTRKYNLHRDFGPGKRERLRKAAFAFAGRLGLGDAMSVGATKPVNRER